MGVKHKVTHGCLVVSLTLSGMQIYTPGYLQNGKPRPVTSDVPRTLTYGQRFSFTYSGVSTIDRVVLNRYGCMSVMHGSCDTSRKSSNVVNLNPLYVVLALRACDFGVHTLHALVQGTESASLWTG